MEDEWEPKWSLGERIRKARETHGWFQTDLAEHLHVSRTTIAGWENGLHRPNHATLKVIASLTDIPLWWLEEDEGGRGNTDTPTVRDPRQLELILTAA